MEDARNLAMRIKQQLAGIGPGFLVRISARPAEWRALLEAIPEPEAKSCATCHAALADGPQPAATYEKS